MCPDDSPSLPSIPPSVTCPHCQLRVKISREHFAEYFKEGKACCDGCKQGLDWWDLLLTTIRDRIKVFGMGMMPIGVTWEVFGIYLQRDKLTKLIFSDHKIPHDARVLEVYFTPEGKLFPLIVHGNRFPHPEIGKEMTLYPMPVEEGTSSDVKVNVLVSWVPHTADDVALENLVTAFRAYHHERYSHMVLPANVAVEAVLERLLAEFLRRTSSREHIERFLQDGASYGHQMNVLLPAFVSFLGEPILPEHIRGGLNRLRERRNEIAHEGVFKSPMQQAEAAECLCAAVFGFHYLRIIEPKLLTRP